MADSPYAGKAKENLSNGAATENDDQGDDNGRATDNNDDNGNTEGALSEEDIAAQQLAAMQVLQAAAGAGTTETGAE